jgi:hypothetical protein
MPGGSATRLAGKRKLRSYSSYKTLKDLREILGKYGVDCNDEKTPPFVLGPVEIDDDDEELE